VKENVELTKKCLSKEREFCTQQTAESTSLAEEFLKDDTNKDTLKFYTGILYTSNAIHLIPSLDAIQCFCELYLTTQSKLPKLSSIVLKLCLNLFNEDIGYRFGMHPSTVSRNFHRILDKAVMKKSFLNRWYKRDVLRLTMPISFWHFL